MKHIEYNIFTVSVFDDDDKLVQSHTFENWCDAMAIFEELRKRYDKEFEIVFNKHNVYNIFSVEGEKR